MSDQRHSLRDSIYEVVGSWPAFALGLIVGAGVTTLLGSVLLLLRRL